MSPQLLLPPQPPWPACLASSLTNLAIIVIGGWLKEEEEEEEGEAQAVQAQAGELVTAPATRCCCSRAASMKSLRTLLVAMLLLRTGLVVVRR